jgi:lipopolysaccharide exporter
MTGPAPTSVRRALAHSFAERYLTIMLALASNMILARLLTPEQIGVYAVTLAVTGVAHVLREFGVGAYLIQERNLRESHVRTAFGLALLIGATLFGALLAIAPAAARFYGAAEMTVLMQIVALNFLVLPFCSISLALLRREMRFKALLYVNTSAMVIGSSTTVALALLGFGPASLAIGSVAGNAATGVGSWLARGRPLPLLPRLDEWRAVLGFGGQSAATGVVTTIAMDINDLVVGKVLGFAPVAILSRAQGLMNMFHRDVMAAIRNVAYPAFARTHREGGAVEPQHLASVAMITAGAWTFYGFLALFSLEVMRVLFGPQWDQAAALVPVYCLAGAFGAVSSLASTALTAVGRIDAVTRTELLFQPLRAALVIAAAIHFGTVLACALAYLASFVLHPLVVFWIKESALPTDFRALARTLGHSVAVAAIALAAPALLSLQAGFGRVEPLPLPVLLLAALGTLLGWIAALAWTRHPIARDPSASRLLARIPCIPRATS